MLNTKEQLHQKIDLINDEEQLSILNETADAYLTNSQQNDLTNEQYLRLEKSLAEIRNGEFITHEELNKNLNQWLTK